MCNFTTEFQDALTAGLLCKLIFTWINPRLFGKQSRVFNCSRATNISELVVPSFQSNLAEKSSIIDTLYSQPFSYYNLWKDGIHLQDLGTNILSSNFITFVNSFLIDNDNNGFWLNHSHQTNDLKFESDLKGLSNLRRAYQNNPLIAYLNINSLREKTISLREILKKTKIDVLCIDETKLDSSFPNHQFRIEGYQFPPLRRDRNSTGGGKTVFVREGFIA